MTRDGGSELLERFIGSFQRAVAAEMEAMRSRMGPFEVTLGGGRRLHEGRTTFQVLTPNEKLAPGGECTFAAGGFEALVTVAALEGGTVTLESDRELPCDGDARLVIYPWFLYERLHEALAGLRRTDRYSTGTALRLFGKLAPRRLATADEEDEEDGELNEAQARAVSLCLSSDPAFVWGPPGTGKTRTLARVVAALLGRGRRVLVTSTTNAAVDQALFALAATAEGRSALDRGAVVRVGTTTEASAGASLAEVARRRDERSRSRLERLAAVRPLYERQARGARELSARLEAGRGPRQLSLFGPTSAEPLGAHELATVFGDARARSLARRPEEAQATALGRRLGRLEAALRRLPGAQAAARQALAEGEGRALREARVVLATMTTMYVNRPLAEERFDTVIAEEAGMAVLPTLFYCACLAQESAVMVGDPRQLPPIVQSSADYVRRVMGRSIFEVTVPCAGDSDLVVMLDHQYRMHPTICSLVSGLFYDGRLTSASTTAGCDAAAAPPFPGEPLAVVDLAGDGVCATQEGAWSRFHEVSAGLCVELARQAVEGGLSSVAIIAPYAEHVRLVGRLLRERLPTEVRRSIECRTVHRFQGNERDMVIFDAVDAEPLKPGVLLTEAGAANLVNVSISRARGKLVIVADRAYFARRAPGSVVDRLLTAALRLQGPGLPTREVPS